MRLPILRDATPVLILVTVSLVFCSYLNRVGDYVADTGPILDRAFRCLLGFGVALVVGSAIATLRATSESFVRGFAAGMLSVVYLTLILVVSAGFQDALGIVVFIAITGATAAALGAILGVLLGSAWAAISEHRGRHDP